MKALMILLILSRLSIQLLRIPELWLKPFCKPFMCELNSPRPLRRFSLSFKSCRSLSDSVPLNRSGNCGDFVWLLSALRNACCWWSSLKNDGWNVLDEKKLLLSSNKPSFWNRAIKKKRMMYHWESQQVQRFSTHTCCIYHIWYTVCHWMTIGIYFSTIYNRTECIIDHWLGCLLQICFVLLINNNMIMIMIDMPILYRRMIGKTGWRTFATNALADRSTVAATW